MEKSSYSIAAGLMPLFMLGFVSHMAPYIYMPSLPDVADCLGLDKSDATSMVSAYYLALSLTLLVAGAIGDRLDKRKLLIGASVIIITGSMTAALTSLFIPALAGWALQGIGAATITIVGQTWVGQHSTRNTITSLFSYMSIILSFAPVVATLTGGLVTDRYSWRYNFYLIGILTSVSALFICRTTPPPPTQSSEISFRKIFAGYRNLLVETVFPVITCSSLVCFLFQGSLIAFNILSLFCAFGVLTIM